MELSNKTGKLDQGLQHVSFSLYSLFNTAALGLTLWQAPAAFADDAVRRKVLVESIGSKTEDSGVAYIKPALDEMGVSYDIFDASTTTLKTATLSLNGCHADYRLR